MAQNHLIPNFKIFENLPAKDVEEILAFCKDFYFTKNQFIYMMGEPASGIFLLKKGRVKISVLNEEGKEKIIDILHPGDSFGEFVTKGRHNYETEAMTLEDVIVCKFDLNIFIEILKQKPQFSLNFINMLNQRLLQAQMEIEELSYETARKRLARILLRLSQKYGKANGDYTRFIIKISHEQLAEMAGANRPYISSLMSTFKKDGVISYKGRYLVIHTNRLKTYL